MIERHFTWDDFERLTESLAKKINESKHFKNRLSKKYDWVISINRGGLIPGVMLSHRLGAKHGVLSVSNFEGKKNKRKQIKRDLYISQIDLIRNHDNILIVDNIARSGETLEAAKSISKKVDPDITHIDTACIHCVSTLENKPTFYVEDIDDGVWIDYPWEHQASKILVLENELQEQITAVG